MIERGRGKRYHFIRTPREKSHTAGRECNVVRCCTVHAWWFNALDTISPGRERERGTFTLHLFHMTREEKKMLHENMLPVDWAARLTRIHHEAKVWLSIKQVAHLVVSFFSLFLFLSLSLLPDSASELLTPSPASPLASRSSSCNPLFIRRSPSDTPHLFLWTSSPPPLCVYRTVD